MTDGGGSLDSVLLISIRFNLFHIHIFKKNIFNILGMIFSDQRHRLSPRLFEDLLMLHMSFINVARSAPNSEEEEIEPSAIGQTEGKVDKIGSVVSWHSFRM